VGADTARRDLHCPRFASLTLCSLALARAGGALRRPRLARRLMHTSGGILIGFGTTLAADR
jgi:threonine/homoserine/homoserine lactone efflux protein